MKLDRSTERAQEAVLAAQRTAGDLPAARAALEEAIVRPDDSQRTRGDRVTNQFG